MTLFGACNAKKIIFMGAVRGKYVGEAKDSPLQGLVINNLILVLNRRTCTQGIYAYAIQLS